MARGASLDGLRDAPRSGCPPTYSREQVGEVIATALTTPRSLALPFASWTLDRLTTYLDDALLYITLPTAWTVGALFALYNDRTTIEAFVCASRHVYNIQNLRSRTFHAIYAFPRFVALTHNLPHWTKQARLARPDLAAVVEAEGAAAEGDAADTAAGSLDMARATTRQLVSYAARVRAQVRWDGRWHVRIPRPHARSSRWAALLIAALIPPPARSN